MKIDDLFRREMKELLDRIEANNALDDLQRAIGWTVSCKDLEYPDRISLFGFFQDPVEASAYANRLQSSVNEGIGEGEEGWECKPFPILPADSWERR